jgi:nucleotide-binding universal stress UspA family protein
MKSILLCTDFSSGSNNAMHFAARLAASLNTTLIIFHADYDSSNVKIDESIPGSAQKKIETSAWCVLAADEMKKKYGIKTLSGCKKGIPVDTIIAAAKQYDVSLIVTGSGGTAAGSGLVGGLVYDLIHALLFPVLAIPQGAIFRPMKKIMLAIDMENKKVFNDAFLQNIIDTFNSQLILTIILTSGTSEEMKKEAALVAVEYRYAEIMHKIQLVENENFVDGLNTCIKENNADVLVIIPHRHHFLERMMNQTLTQKVLKNVTVPMLSLPQTK